MAEAPTLRARKRARSRAELLDSALTLFERQGFATTTVDQIVDHAQYSPSTFFRYFGSKEDVLFAGVEHHLSELARHLDNNLGSTTIWQAVVASVEATSAGFLADDTEFGARRIELWMSEPALRARYIEHAAAWETTIITVVSSHRGNPAGDDVYASVIAMAAVSAFRIAVESIPGRHGSFPERLHEAFRILGAGLAQEPPES